MIRLIENKDFERVTEIYNHYILTSIATFEEEPISSEEMKQRIKEKTKTFPWIVYTKGTQVLGYAYATTWNNRCAYKNTVEVSVYLSPDVKGKGIGTELYAYLIQWLKDHNYRVVIGGVSLPNPASVRLHEKFGFEKVAHFKEVGFKFNQWIDVGYWQLTIK